MALLSLQEMANIQADLDNTFQTFVRDIVVWKEPIRTPLTSTQAAGGTFGFGGADIPQEFSYTPVSGIFPAVVRYATPKDIGKSEVILDTNTMIPIGEVRIQVRPDAYAYISTGPTDKISFDNRDFTFVGKVQACPFLGSLYYMYQLQPKT